MKKSIIVSAFAMCAMAVSAQTGDMGLTGTKFGDNWSIGLRAGGVTPLKHSAFFGGMRPVFGVEIGKQISPVFGLSLQGMGNVNMSRSATVIDASDVSLLGRVNLTNLFAGYLGEPRAFELEALGGVGWLHYYQDGPGDSNSWSTRLGMNMNFNMGEAKAWTLSIRPAVIYDMQGDFNRHKSRFNANCAGFELTAGLIYHFGNSNGERYFTYVRPYNAAEIDGLNAMVNGLRDEVVARDAQLLEAAEQVNNLQQQLKDCQDQPRTVQTANVPEAVVSFKVGQSVIETSQQPTIERVAKYLKDNSNTILVIKGYASPEGPLELNNKLSAARAEVVKSLLINKYGISPSRITSEGEGIGDIFSEPSWNRVSILTIDGTAQ